MVGPLNTLDVLIDRFFLSDSGSQVSFIAKNLRHPSVPIDDFKLIVRDSYNIQIPSIWYLHFNSFPMQSKDRYFNSNKIYNVL